MFQGEMRLIFWLKGLVGAAIFLEHASRSVAHNGILRFVGPSKYSIQRFKLFLCQTGLSKSEKHTHLLKQLHNKISPEMSEQRCNSRPNVWILTVS